MGPVPKGATRLAKLRDVDVAGALPGQVLALGEDGKWRAVAAGAQGQEGQDESLDGERDELELTHAPVALLRVYHCGQLLRRVEADPEQGEFVLDGTTVQLGFVAQDEEWLYAQYCW